jgi:hypothetical protein
MEFLWVSGSEQIPSSPDCLLSMSGQIKICSPEQSKGSTDRLVGEQLSLCLQELALMVDFSPVGFDLAKYF